MAAVWLHRMVRRIYRLKTAAQAASQDSVDIADRLGGLPGRRIASYEKESRVHPPRVLSDPRKNMQLTPTVRRVSKKDWYDFGRTGYCFAFGMNMSAGIMIAPIGSDIQRVSDV